ncbi:hypothetical protein RUM44_006354 [Polyplax serrata]|uniref:Hexosyltransferase n=1 Tax=Polyplax serrata TaxID=468196 RepID=A0ABR1AHV7_POLSC
MYQVAALGNVSQLTSSRSEKKEEEISSLYTVQGSIRNRSNSSIFSESKIIKNKTEEKKTSDVSNVVPVVNLMKDNLPAPAVVPDVKASVIQRIPPKENYTVDYIGQGVTTRNLYDSGFRVPNVDLCPDFGRRLKIVILITSAPSHGDARRAIRQTWGHFQMRSDVAMAFILGRSPNETQIKEESALYEDIILANFVDSYNNLTLKTTSILEWVDNYCNQARFVLKTDDDMFINIPKLLDFVTKHWDLKRRIYGKLASKWKPIRNKASKYYVSREQYKQPVFPSFTTGPAYLMTSDVIHDLYTTALNMIYLKLEDVFTTGIVAQERGIRRVHVSEFLNRRLSVTSCYIHKAISIHMVKPFEQYDLWKRLLDGRTKC